MGFWIMGFRGVGSGARRVFGCGGVLLLLVWRLGLGGNARNSGFWDRRVGCIEHGEVLGMFGVCDVFLYFRIL